MPLCKKKINKVILELGVIILTDRINFSHRGTETQRQVKKECNKEMILFIPIRSKMLNSSLSLYLSFIKGSNFDSCGESYLMIAKSSDEIRDHSKAFHQKLGLVCRLMMDDLSDLLIYSVKVSQYYLVPR